MNQKAQENAREARERMRRVHELHAAGFEWPTATRHPDDITVHESGPDRYYFYSGSTISRRKSR